MARHRTWRLLVVVALVALGGAGCAAHWAYRQGQDAGDRGDWDLAVARFTKALQKDPNNIRYKISLESARIQASRIHYDEAKKALAAQDLEKAAQELQIASNYDPANRSAADDLTIVRQRILKRDEERRDREELEQRKARAQATTRVPLPVLSPRSPVPITMRFEDGSMQKIFESLGRIAGVNVLFDEGFRDKKASVNLTGVTFQEALDRLTFVNRLFYKVVDQNTIIIVPESRQKRVAYDELLLRTFFVMNAEINDTVNLVKTLAKVTTVAGNPSLGAITVLGTVDQVAMAERIIEANDKARGEVVVEVQILEVDRNNLKKWGIDISNYNAKLTLAPTTNEEATAGVLTTRAYLLSSLNLADWVVSIPSTILVQFLQNESTVRILAAPRLRAAEGKKAELKIGQEVPIPQTSYTVGLSGGTTGGYLPATSFTYKNVGVNLAITPRVAASGDVTLEMAAEFSLLGDDRNVGSDTNKILVPTFFTRNVTGVLRLRDGETGLIGGLVQGREASSFAGAIGMDSIPILGKLFGSHQHSNDQTEVIMSITPRVVRAPKVTDEDLIALRVGTQEVPKVEGARPPLFGEPETPPQEQQGQGTGAATPAAPPPQTPGRAPQARLGPTPEEQKAMTGPGSQARLPATTPPAATAPPFPELEAPPVTPPATAPPASPAQPPPSASAQPAPSGSAPPAPTSQERAPGAAATPAESSPATVLLSPPELALKAGQVGTLAVVVVGAKDVQSVEISLTWDPNVAEITDVAPGSLLTLDGTPLKIERAIESGHARVRFARATGAVGSGAVASVTIRGAKVGSGPVAVESGVLGRTGGQDRPAPPAPGRIVVAP
jgi:general secretion pathway protein D